jgi:ribosomal protein L6P/L9E
VISSKSNMYEVINVISSFQPIGSEIKGVTKNYAFLLAIVGVGFMILVLLLRILNRYLASYDK